MGGAKKTMGDFGCDNDTDGMGFSLTNLSSLSDVLNQQVSEQLTASAPLLNAPLSDYYKMATGQSLPSVQAPVTTQVYGQPVAISSSGKVLSPLEQKVGLTYNQMLLIGGALLAALVGVYLISRKGGLARKPNPSSDFLDEYIKSKI